MSVRIDSYGHTPRLQPLQRARVLNNQAEGPVVAVVIEVTEIIVDPRGYDVVGIDDHDSDVSVAVLVLIVRVEPNGCVRQYCHILSLSSYQSLGLYSGFCDRTGTCRFAETGLRARCHPRKVSPLDWS